MPLPAHTIHEDDGVDPRIFFSRESRQRNQRRSGQVCRTAERTISMMLEGDVRDAFLHACTVQRVEEDEHTNALRVVVEAPMDLDPREVQDRFANLEGFFRHGLAQALVRKRVPAISFVVVPGSSHEEEP